MAGGGNPDEHGPGTQNPRPETLKGVLNGGWQEVILTNTALVPVSFTLVPQPVNHDTCFWWNVTSGRIPADGLTQPPKPDRKRFYGLTEPPNPDRKLF